MAFTSTTPRASSSARSTPGARPPTSSSPVMAAWSSWVRRSCTTLLWPLGVISLRAISECGRCLTSEGSSVYLGNWCGFGVMEDFGWIQKAENHKNYNLEPVFLVVESVEKQRHKFESDAASSWQTMPFLAYCSVERTKECPFALSEWIISLTCVTAGF